MNPLWQLRVCGTPCLVHLNATDRQLPLSRKDAALLVYVALQGEVSSAQMATLLWPAADARNALNNLRQRVHRLRRESGARLLEVANTARRAHDLLVEPRPDLAALERDPTAWDEALLGTHSYDDANEFTAWLAQVRKTWADARVEALARIASEAEQQGQIARAMVYAQRLLAHEPLSEHVHRRLMRLHYMRGDTAAAVAAFEACERLLKDELGLKPSAETIALLATIERGALPAPTSATPIPAALLRPPRAVGRERERLQLERAHHEGQIATLVGEAGMGKTRLLQDFAATRPEAVYAQARPGDVSVPYGALARLLRAVVSATPGALDRAPRGELVRVVPEFGDVGTVGPPGQTARLQGAIEQLLLAGVQTDGLTLVVDDLHFADRASIEMLRALVDAEPLAAVRWVFAHRPIGTNDEDGTLLQSLADSPHARWIALSALTDADLAELLDSLALPGIDAASFASALARHTGGNPLYVLETLRAAGSAPAASTPGLVLPRPQSIAHMIDRRLQRLSERALTLGRVAALAGADFSPELAEHALATPALALAGAWAELEAADVLRGNAFAHDLVRDGMLRATPNAIAVHAHRLIAQFLDRRSAEPACIAAHWLAAGAHQQAALGFQQAADRARRLSRPREQARLLVQAGDAFTLDGDFGSGVMMHSLALLPTLHGVGFETAQALSDRLVATAGSGPLAGLVWARRASLMMHAGQAAQAEAAARRALPLITSDQQDLQVEALSALAIACAARGSAEEGLELMRPWIGRIDELSDPQSRIGFCSAHAVLLFNLDRLDEASHAVAKQIALGRAANDDDAELVPALLSLAALEIRRGDAARARSIAAEAASAQPEYDKPGTVPGWTRFILGSATCAAGLYDEGLATLEGALRMLESSTAVTVHSNTEVATAEVWLQIGQTARAGKLMAHEPSGLTAAGVARRLLARAAIQRALGERLESALDPTLPETARRAGEYWVLLARIEQARRSEPRLAIGACARVMAMASRNGDKVVKTLAAAVRLGALHATGCAEAAVAAAFELEQLLLGCRSTLLYPPELQLACFRAHTAFGQRDDAARCLTDARNWIRRVALPNVPDAYRDTFLNRHAVNMAVQAEGLRWEVSDLGVKPA